MPRVRRSTNRRDSRKKTLQLASGYFLNKSKLYRSAQEAVEKALRYGYIGRKRKKRDYRRLFIVRINAGCRLNAMSYSKFIGGLKKAGIELKQQDEDQGTLASDLAAGKFQIGYNSAAGGPTPFYELRNDMDSGSFSNYGKYSNPAADALIAQYLKSTSITEQKSIVLQLGKIMNDEVPVLPVTESADWFQYDTTTIDGWPNADNPYCQPAPWNIPDSMVLLDTIWGK